MTFFSLLQTTVCTFCGHDIKEDNENIQYRDVCPDCLEQLDEK